MSTTTTSRPGFFRRLGRAFTILVKVVFFLAVFAGILVAAWFGFTELRRSFDSLATRNDLNARRIEELRADVVDLTSERVAQERTVSSLEEEVSSLEGEMATMTERLATDLARQQDVLTALEAQVGELAAASSTTAEEVDTLSAGVVALQGDLNENQAAVDELGGNVDEMSMHMTEMGEAFGALETEVMDASGEAVTAVSDMSQALTLFRAWEMVYRARLRLLEQNVGLATQDVAVAQALLGMLVENSEAESAAALAAVQQRLDLAAVGLRDDPDTAVRDLESAWETLDTILSGLLGVPQIVLPETATTAATAAATAAISPTVTITATQPITTSP
ncbi:MAG: hypothetical protein H6658_15375 [Ardenticatenaceae bacterium]|nr:hypothetical protein [Ardenticatenaceae bacterium]